MLKIAKKLKHSSSSSPSSSIFQTESKSVSQDLMHQQSKLDVTSKTPNHDMGPEDEFYTSDSQNEKSDDDDLQSVPQTIFDFMSGMINDPRKPGQKTLQLQDFKITKKEDSKG